MTRTIWSKFIAAILALAMVFALIPARPTLAADIERTTSPNTLLTISIRDIFGEDPSVLLFFGFTQPTADSLSGTLYQDEAGATEVSYDDYTNYMYSGDASVTFRASAAGEYTFTAGFLDENLDPVTTKTVKIIVAASAPTVTSISPSSGLTAGGTSVTITGTNFTGATGVTIGGAAATGVTVVNATTITATTPAGTAGAKDVVVTTPGGTGTGTGLFTYTAPLTYTASVTPTSKTFPEATAGYGAQTAQQFTIRNTGTGEITSLAAVLSTGTGFEISTALSATIIASEATATVSVRPKTGLAAGTYTDTLTITGSNGVSLTVSLSFTINAAPVATNVQISGTAQVGQTLIGSYTYSDVNGDLEGVSTFKWYRSDDAAGTNKAAISGATTLTYTLQAADSGKYISFEVTPAALTGAGPGMAVESGRVGSVSAGWSILGQIDPGIFADVAFGNGYFVAVEYDNGRVYKSTDGLNWTQTATVSGDPGWIAFGNGRFVITDNTSGQERAFYSDDGVLWQGPFSVFSGGGLGSLCGIAYGPQGFVTVESDGSYGSIHVSADGETWSQALPRTDNEGAGLALAGVAYGAGIYAVVGSGGVIYTSPDAANWTKRATPIPSEYYMGVCYGAGQFVAVGQGGAIIASTDGGATWTLRDTISGVCLNDVYYGNGKYHALGYGGVIVSSADGVTWVQEASGVTDGIWGGAYGNGYFVAVTEGGEVLVKSSPAAVYGIAVQNDGHGSGSATPVSASAGTSVTLSNTPAGGYLFKEWQVIGPADLSITGNTFTMPDEAVIVKAVFEADLPAQAAPVAANVQISGTAQAGQTLTGSYTYSDVNGDLEGVSTFKWYRSDNAAGTNKAAISGATALTYTLQAADSGKYISFEVTPAALTGTRLGTAVESGRVGPVSAAPTYTASVTPTSKTFTAATVGYGVQTAQAFTIQNTGTGEITSIAAGFTTGTAFEISTALSATTIASGGTATLSVRPKTGLLAGTYTDTLTITGSNGVSLTVSLSFTVNGAAPTDKVLMSIVSPAAITGVANGTAKTIAALGLPATVTLLTDSSNVSANVTWDAAACSYNPLVATAQTFTVNGVVSLPTGVSNPHGISLNVAVSVSVNAASDIYVKEQHIVSGGNQVTVDLTKGSTILSSGQVNSLIEKNKTKPVTLQGGGYTITFPAGSLQNAGGNRNYDLGLDFNKGESYGAIKSLTGNDFVLMLDFNHSGALPGTAQIRVYVGTRYAGRALHYYYYNTHTGNLEYMQAAKVSSDGYITIAQSRCSSYVFSLHKIDGALDIPQTGGDNRSILLYALLCGAFAAGILACAVMNRKRKSTLG